MDFSAIPFNDAANAIRRRGNPRYEITVGPANADVAGSTGRAIQIAIDALAVRGGGTVRVLPGTYVLDDAIRMRPDITLLGERNRSILRRGPLVWSPLALDADIAQTETTPAKLDGWKVGMAACIWDRASGWGLDRTPGIVTDIAGSTLQLHENLTAERLAEKGGRVVNYFPMVLGLQADRAVLDGFTIDAAVEDPEGVLAGMRNAVIYFWRSVGVTIRNVTERNGRGDGIILSNKSVGGLVEDCETSHNSNYGIHPGSHSRGAIVRRCHIHHNGSDGLYICWGISHGEFVDNDIHHNGLIDYRSGISIGHKDTDNLIARNRVYENKKFGVCFRRKTEGNAAHRVRLVENVIENNGSAPDELADVKKRIEPWESIGCGVHVSGMTRDLVMEKNIIRETRLGAARYQKHGVVLEKGVSGAKMTGNKVEGHPESAVVDRSEGANQVEG